MAKRKYSAELKTKIVLEVLREERQLGEIASEHNISPNQIRNWKKEFLENSERVFSRSSDDKKLKEENRKLKKERDELLMSVGQASFERDWLKKNLKSFSDPITKKSLIKHVTRNDVSAWIKTLNSSIPFPDKIKLTRTRQCELLHVPRTSTYRKHKEPDRTKENLIKERLDYWHTMMPYMGTRKLSKILSADEILNDKGIDCIGRKLVRRYMHEMGIHAAYPKPNTSKRNKEHKVYPYLLRNMDIYLPNLVWAVDITYIKMAHGHMYLTAIIDWYSRYIVGYALSDTLDTAPVLSAVKDATQRYGVPAILNSDQGSQFTSEEYTSYLKSMKIKQSMDGKARWVDNVVIERWFRSLKTEKIYIEEFRSPRELRKGIKEYIEEYNCLRPHETFEYSTPESVYVGKFKETVA